MRRLLVGLLALLSVLALTGAKPLPSSSSSFTFSPESGQRGDPVEQQTPCYWTTCHDDPTTWVVNPTGCIWDVDEYNVLGGSGDLDAGASASGSLCVIADGLYYSAGDDPHVLGVDLYAASSLLTVQVSTSAGNADNQATVPAVWSAAAKAYRYHWCAPNGVDPPGPFPTVDGSNGGIGYRDDLSLTVGNPTGRKVRGVRGWFGAGAAAYLQIDCPRTWSR